MSIETKIKKKTTETEYQEINIYKLATNDKWHISCSIPKFARKYRKFLVSGFEVINKDSRNVIEIHGEIDNCTVSIGKKIKLSDEQRKLSSERAKNNLAKARANNNNF